MSASACTAGAVADVAVVPDVVAVEGTPAAALRILNKYHN